jgi:hypothetical protein
VRLARALVASYETIPSFSPFFAQQRTVIARTRHHHSIRLAVAGSRKPEREGKRDLPNQNILLESHAVPIAGFVQSALRAMRLRDGKAAPPLAGTDAAGVIGGGPDRDGTRSRPLRRYFSSFLIDHPAPSHCCYALVFCV